MPISDYIDDLNNNKGSVSYLDSSSRRQVQLPLGISWYTGSGTTDPNDLYTDDPSLYFVYSGGWHQTAITSQVRDRYNGVTITLLEGGPVQLYIQAADSVFSFIQNFYGAPYTTSGDAGSEELILSTYYPTTPVDPESLAVEVPSPGTYKVVFPHATDSQAFVVSHSGAGSYRVSQIIPRRAVQAYDIDVNSIKAYHVTAELIDTISLRVADSIVVGPELIGAKSIDGSKIVDGTISGILMRDGTVTGNKILAGTISGVLIAGNTITGNNIVANTISGELITAGTITADNIATRTITADRIVLSGIVANLLGPEAVTAAALASGAVISGKLAANSITANNVTAGIIQGYHVAADTITGANIFAATISGSLMTAGTITFDKIASNTLTSGQIANGTITGQNILAGTVSGVLITDGTIAASKITANTITASQIAAGTITATEIATGTITASKIAAGTITATEIAANTITANKLSVSQLDAVAANMGTLTVNSGITIGTAGYLWAGAGSASAPTTGLKIYTTSGVSRLTTFSGGIQQIDVDSAGSLTAGANGAVKLYASGLNFTSPYPYAPNADASRYYLDTAALANNSSIIRWKSTAYNSRVPGQGVAGYTTGFYEPGASKVYMITQAGGNVEGWSSGYADPYSDNAQNWVTAFSKNTSDVILYAEAAFEYTSSANLKLHAENDATSLTYRSSPGGMQPADILFAINDTGLQGVPSSANINVNTTISGALNVLSNFGVNTNKFTVISTTGATTIAGATAINNTLTAGNTTISGTLSVAGNFISGTNTGDQRMPVYGDGADGAVTFNGSSTYNFATYSSPTYTLTRDVWATTVNVSSGYTVITAGYRIFATTSIYAAGNIHNNGSDGSGLTAGTGGLGGFFKAGGAGAAGLGTAVAVSNGNTQATPTANTWVGGLGGRGAQGRSAVNASEGGMLLSASLTTPANVDGGSRVTSNIVNYLNRYVIGATNWQMTPSVGGGSGGKSALGTTAITGGGGGGGGIIFLASPTIQCSGAVISANGGVGGNASGTGGNFGGGGGGGGGIVAYMCKTDLGTYTANGGAGGTSVIGTSGTFPIATSNGTATAVDPSNILVITPTRPLVKGSLYILAVHLNITGGVGGSGINSITGCGISWTNLSTRVGFNSVASPARAVELWYGIKANGNYSAEPDFVDDLTIKIALSNANTAQRVILDEIQNVNESSPIVGNNATNAVDSAQTLTVTLPTAPTAGNLVYSVFGRSAGTSITAGAGNAMINVQSNGPQLTSQVSSAQQANAQSHTTASAIAGVSLEIAKSTAGQNGSYGWNGKVIRLYG
jgi:hypothetical protein